MIWKQKNNYFFIPLNLDISFWERNSSRTILFIKAYSWAYSYQISFRIFLFLAEQSNWIIPGNVKQFRIFTPAGISVWKGDGVRLEVGIGGTHTQVSWWYKRNLALRSGMPRSCRWISQLTGIMQSLSCCTTCWCLDVSWSFIGDSFLFIFNRNQENWEMDSK